MLSPAVPVLDVSDIQATSLAGGARDAPAAYVDMCHLRDSVEVCQSSFSPRAQEISGDIRNYTDQTPVIQIGEVVVDNSAKG